MASFSKKKSKSRDASVAALDTHQTHPWLSPALATFIGTIGIIWVTIANRDMIAFSLRGLRGAGVFSQYLAWPDFDRGIPLLLLAVLFTIAISTGRIIFRMFAIDEVSLSEELGFSLGLGLGAISLASLLAGMAGYYSVNAIRLGLAVLGVAGLAINFFFLPRGNAPPTPKSPASTWLAPVSCILAGLILLNLFSAMAPEVHYDSLIYHLALPKLYLLNGSIIPTPHNIYSGMPFNAEMLYGVGLALGGESLAKLIPWGIGLAILGLIFSWVKKRAGDVSPFSMPNLVAVPG